METYLRNSVTIAAIGIYLTVAAVLLIYSLVKLWPTLAPNTGKTEVTTTNGAPDEQRTEPKQLDSPPANRNDNAAAVPPALNGNGNVTTAPPPATGVTAGTEDTPAGPSSKNAAGGRPREQGGQDEEQDRRSPAPARPEEVIWLGRKFAIFPEQRLLLLVLLAGALGSLIHATRSFFWYVGNRGFVSSWTAWYFMIPLAGGVLAAAFYLVLRGGFFSPTSTIDETSPYGFVALAILVGMFSEQATEKLKQIAETVFTEPRKGRNTVTTRPVPVVTATDPAVVVTPAIDLTLKVRGNNFVKESKIWINGQERDTTFVSKDELTTTLDPADVAAPPTAIEVCVTTPPPGGGTSDPVTLQIT